MSIPDPFPTASERLKASFKWISWNILSDLIIS